MLCPQCGEKAAVVAAIPAAIGSLTANIRRGVLQSRLNRDGALTSASCGHTWNPDPAAMSGYDYIEREGAVFRRPAGAGPLTEIWHAEQARWVPYTGDGTKLALYGNPVTEAELPAGALDPALLPAAR